MNRPNLTKRQLIIILSAILLFAVPLATLAFFWTGDDYGVKPIDKPVITAGVQVKYDDGDIITLTSANQPLGSLTLHTLSWTNPSGAEVTHMRFMSTLNIQGDNLLPNSEYEVSPVMVDLRKKLHYAGQIKLLPIKVVDRTGMHWNVDSQGEIDRKMYLIGSYETATIGDFTDDNINTDGKDYGWTWFVQPPGEIISGDKVEYTSDWHARVTATGSDNQQIDKTASASASIKLTYHSSGQPGSLSIALSSTPQSALSIIPVDPVYLNIEALSLSWQISWDLIVLTIAGIALMGVAIIKRDDW